MNDKTNNQRTTSTAEENRSRQKYLSELLTNAMSHGAREMNPEVMKDFKEKEAKILAKYQKEK